MSEGFIKIYRQLLEWEWYTDVNTKTLFLHCLLKANFKTKKYQKSTVKKGSFVTSLETLSRETGLTIQQTRTALKHLISTGELTSKSTSKNRIITVVNYEKFQDDNRQNNKQLTSKRQTKQQSNNKQVTSNQQAANKQLTTVEERKNVYLSPTGIDIQEEGKKAAAPSAAEGGEGLPEKEKDKNYKPEQKAENINRVHRHCAGEGSPEKEKDKNYKPDCTDTSVREMKWTFGDLKKLASTVRGGNDYNACDFRRAFVKSGTAFPDDWQDIFRRFAAADSKIQDEFLKSLESGAYRDKWGAGQWN